MEGVQKEGTEEWRECDKGREEWRERDQKVYEFRACATTCARCVGVQACMRACRIAPRVGRAQRVGVDGALKVSVLPPHRGLVSGLSHSRPRPRLEPRRGLFAFDDDMMELA